MSEFLISQQNSESKRRLGLFLILLSAVLFSLSGVFTKIIRSDTWTILTWRGLIGAALIFAYVVWRHPREGNSQLFALGWRGWALASVGSLASLSFIAAFKLTYVANVTVIYAVVPFVAAYLEWLILREPVNPRTMMAALVCIVGIGILATGVIGSPNLLGDAVALVMTMLNAIYVVLIRVFKNTPVVLAGGLASIQLFVVGWLFTNPLAVSPGDIAYIIAFSITFAAASISWTEGARLVPAAEVGLLGSADIPLAILLAWVFLTEVPPITSLIGGGIVLIALYRYSRSRLRIEQ
jgi:drug/metabolite transporter (DMT)-like permease